MCSVCSEAEECIRSCRPCCHLTDVSVSDPERDRHRGGKNMKVALLVCFLILFAF